MLIVEIKSYSRKRGMEMLHYLEVINNGAGDRQLADYEVTHYRQSGSGRQRVRSIIVRGHPRHHGADELLRRAFNELRLDEVREQTANAIEHTGDAA